MHFSAVYEEGSVSALWRIEAASKGPAHSAGRGTKARDCTIGCCSGRRGSDCALAAAVVASGSECRGFSRACALPSRSGAVFARNTSTASAGAGWANASRYHRTLVSVLPVAAGAGTHQPWPTSPPSVLRFRPTGPTRQYPLFLAPGSRLSLALYPQTPSPKAPHQNEVLQRQAYGFRNFDNYRLRVKVMCS
jgi:hypothetical protein